MRKLFTGIAVSMAALFAVQSAGADVIVTPSAVIRNDFGEFSGSYPVVNMINQTNNTPVFNSGVDDFDAYAAGNPTATSNNEPTQFFGQSNNFGPILDFDLGQNWIINQLGLFNNQARGFLDIDIYTATQADFSDGVFVGNFTFTVSGNANEASPFEVRALAGTIGRYVRLDVNAFETTILGGKQITFGVTQVPAPGALALLGLGGLAITRRRRNR